MAERKVFIAIHNGGCEGYGKPLAVFETRYLADIFKEGAEAGYTSGVEIFEMPIRGPTPVEDEAL